MKNIFKSVEFGIFKGRNFRKKRLKTPPKLSTFLSVLSFWPLKNMSLPLPIWLSETLCLFVAPGNVTNINLRVNKNTIRATWDLPQCKENIKEMKVQYRKKGESNWGMRSSTVTATDKEFIINCLENGVEYEVRIVVVDIIGKEHMTQASGTAKIGKSRI